MDDRHDSSHENWDALERRQTAFRAGLLENRVALVSGGGSGIGKCAAWLMSRLGATVIVCGRNAEKLKRIEAAAAVRGRRIESVSLDIRDGEGVQALFDRVFSQHGRLDILVNSAGGQFPKPAIDLSANGWSAVVDTNLTGTWAMMQAAARGWRDGGSAGAIINIVAVVKRGMLGAAHSAAARAGVIALSKTVAVEWAPLNIRVNCIAAGTILTEGMHNYPEATREAFRRSNPMMRYGDPWEIAEACVFLGTEAGGFINGEVLAIDGGAQVWGEIWSTEKPGYFGRTIWPER